MPEINTKLAIEGVGQMAQGLRTVFLALTQDATPTETPAAVFTATGAADYLSVGKTTFYELVKAGEFKSITIAGMPRYRRRDLDRYIERMAKNS